MLDKFWDSVASRLADRWASAAAPAVMFALGGLLAWAHGHGGLHKVEPSATWLAKHSVLAQISVLVLVLAAVATGAAIVQSLVPGALRLMEGYFPRPLWWLRRILVDRVDRRAADVRSRLQVLAPLVQKGRGTAEMQAEFQRLDLRRRRVPAHSNRRMPTRLGNTLRAAENRPTDRYGLDVVALWPHLWLVFPDTARTELTAARGAVDRAVAGVLWGLLFLVFLPWAWWVVPVSLAVVLVAWGWWLPQRAAVFADLIEATVALYRMDLYARLRWPPPANPREEIESGRLLTRYLVRGSDSAEPVFVRPEHLPETGG